MNIKVEIVDGVQVIELAESHLGDERLIVDVGNRLQELALENDTGRLLLDIKPVLYVSSLMVGQLISLKKICGRENIDLKICNVSTVIIEVLKLVRFDRMIKIYDTREDAMVAFETSEHDTRVTVIAGDQLNTVRENASKGNSDFQYQLGLCYEEGNGLDADPEEALKWYRLSAEQGHRDGLYKVGMAFAYGIGTEQNIDIAMPWYQQAAEAGHADAQYMVGLALQHGLAGTTDTEQAVTWYNLAAKQGHEKAKEALTELSEA